MSETIGWWLLYGDFKKKDAGVRSEGEQVFHLVYITYFLFTYYTMVGYFVSFNWYCFDIIKGKNGPNPLHMQKMSFEGQGSSIRELQAQKMNIER